jgi:ankyrin repeat protein
VACSPDSTFDYLGDNIYVESKEQALVPIVQALVNACPDAAKVRNHKGQLPLHKACSGGAPVEVVQCLLDAFPEGFKQEEENGDLPLHVACKYKYVDLEVVRFLVENYPDSISRTDRAGRLPIYWA